MSCVVGWDVSERSSGLSSRAGDGIVVGQGDSWFNDGDAGASITSVGLVRSAFCVIGLNLRERYIGLPAS